MCGVLALCAFSVRAAEISMIAADQSSPTSSFNTGTNWADHVAPGAGNTYKTGAYQMRSPYDMSTANNYVFAGDRLTLSSLGGILWKTAGLVTVNDLVLSGGTVAHGLDNFAAKLAGTITVSSASSFSAFEPNPRDFLIYSTIKGSADLSFTLASTGTSKQVSLLADNSAFTGKLLLRGAGKLSLSCEENLGGNPAAFAANQLELAGTTLLATNSLTLDDPNRGLYLNMLPTSTAPAATGGVFEVNNAATVIVACAISGPGPLTKRGNGALILATTNTYAGLTTVEAGLLRLAPGAVSATSSLVATGASAVVIGRGAMSNVTLVAGAQFVAEQTGWDVRNLTASNAVLGVDLSQADPATPLIRVSGTLTKYPYQVFQFTVVTNGVGATPYKILSAPNLSSFRDCDFCVNPPWIGELSRTGDGSSQTLVFTPTPPEKIVFKTAGDVINDTSFTNSNWSNGQPPSSDKTYVSRSFEMRTPPSGNNTFPGRRLFFDGQNISLKGLDGWATITNLAMMNNGSFSMTEPTGSRLRGDLLLYPLLDASKTYALLVNGWSVYRTLWLDSKLSGYGDFYMVNAGNPALGSVLTVMTGANTNFFGRIRVEGHTNFWVRITSEENLGGVPPAFRADQMIFNGGGLSVTNDVVLDDATRGLTLLATGSTGGTSPDTGAFTNNTPVADRLFDGGCVLRPESSTVTLAISCPIAGAGRLSMAGRGLLVLGGANSYTGQTSILSGSLRPDSTNAFGASPVRVRSGASLVRRYPDANLPNGVTLGATITFESGAYLDIVLAAGYTVNRNFTVPLFTVPSGVSIDPGAVPVRHGLTNYKATVTTSTVGTRTLVSASLTFQGSLVLLR
jgi:autotransporter-associated beta strand protein